MEAAIEPSSTVVGLVGLGVMGRGIAHNLLRAGYELHVSTRTPSTAASVLEAGARWQDSPRAVAAASDVVITIVGTPADVREVVLGDDGVLAGARAGTVLVDMTTSEPSLAVEVAAAAAAQDVASLDAPVSGGDVGARDGTLSIMVGGDRAAFDALVPIWDVVGRTVVHQGPPGAGQHTKVVNQVLVAAGMLGLAEALLYARRSGLAPESVLRSVSGGAAGSWALSNLAPRVLADDLEPGFRVDHFLKDMGIALREAEALGVDLRGLRLVHGLYEETARRGRARQGTQALVVTLAEDAEQAVDAAQAEDADQAEDAEEAVDADVPDGGGEGGAGVA